MDQKGKIQKTDVEWKKILTPEQYQTLRQKGTEVPFTGRYYNSASLKLKKSDGAKS